MMPVRPSRALFVRAYLAHRNATRAAIEAGYSRRTARFQASRLLTKPDVSAQVERGMAARSEAARATADDVAGCLWAVVISNPFDLVAAPPEGLRLVAVDHPSMAGVRSMELERLPGGAVAVRRIVVHDKALRLLMAHLGMAPLRKGRPSNAARRLPCAPSIEIREARSEPRARTA